MFSVRKEKIRILARPPRVFSAPRINNPRVQSHLGEKQEVGRETANPPPRPSSHPRILHCLSSRVTCRYLRPVATRTLKRLRRACLSPAQTDNRAHSLGRVFGTHRPVCTAISSRLLSVFCPLSFRRDYGMLSSCGSIHSRKGMGGGRQRSRSVLLLSSHTLLSSHAVMNTGSGYKWG